MIEYKSQIKWLSGENREFNAFNKNVISVLLFQKIETINY